MATKPKAKESPKRPPVKATHFPRSPATVDPTPGAVSSYTRRAPLPPTTPGQELADAQRQAEWRSKPLVFKPGVKPDYQDPAVRQQLMDRICGFLEDGLSMAKAVAQTTGAPTQAYVYRWLNAEPALQKQFSSAREVGHLRMADELVEIADDAAGDNEHAVRVRRAHLRVETRKWILSRMLPKIYGDRITQVMEGSLSVTAPIDQVKRELAELLGRHSG